MMELIVEYWIEVVLGMIVTGLSFCYKHLQKKVKEHELLKEGLIAILHDRLIQSGMYFLSKDEISLLEFDNFKSMYEAYHKLGGNGTGTEIYERIGELPIKK